VSSSLGLVHIDEQADEIGIARAAPGAGDHGAVEPALGLEDAGGIDEDHLSLAGERDAAHLGARRLHLARDDRDLGADQGVEQGRFAGIRRADQRDKAAAGYRSLFHPVRRFTRQHRLGSGAFGGAFRFSFALGGRKPCTTAATRNTGAWSGPLRPSSL
jgi:hypothetical protein